MGRFSALPSFSPLPGMNCSIPKYFCHPSCQIKNEDEDGGGIISRTQGVGDTGSPTADLANIFSGFLICQQ